MKALTPLGDDPAYIDRFTNICDCKRLATRKKLQRMHKSVLTRYNAFHAAIAEDNLHSMSPHAWTADSRATLRSCYDNSTKPLRALKEAIRSNQPAGLLRYCPMCGTTLPQTFDHYLPAEHFPELAVHPLNLVPCCTRCNSTKDHFWLSPQGDRCFLHAYFDEIPREEFLEVDLYERHPLTGVGAEFSLSRPRGIKNSLWRTIKTHFERLDLLVWYGDCSTNEIPEIIGNVKAHLEAGGTNPRSFLRKLSQQATRTYGNNHWRVLLMRALADYRKLSDWMA